MAGHVLGNPVQDELQAGLVGELDDLLLGGHEGGQAEAVAGDGHVLDVEGGLLGGGGARDGEIELHVIVLLIWSVGGDDLAYARSSMRWWSRRHPLSKNLTSTTLR